MLTLGLGSEKDFTHLLLHLLLRGGRGIGFNNKGTILKLAPVSCGACSSMFVFDIQGSIYMCEDLLSRSEYSIGKYFP